MIHMGYVAEIARKEAKVEGEVIRHKCSIVSMGRRHHAEPALPFPQHQAPRGVQSSALRHPRAQRFRATHRRSRRGQNHVVRALLEQLDGHYSTALIMNPVMNGDELMKAIAVEFGLNVKGLDRMKPSMPSAIFVETNARRKGDVLIVTRRKISPRAARTSSSNFQHRDRRPQTASNCFDGPAGIA